MMYTVVWRPYAEQSLAKIWTAADDKQSITDAANAIDGLLRTDPLGVGESREENVRFHYVAPLAVYYDVFADDRRVAVWAVWKYPLNR